MPNQAGGYADKGQVRPWQGTRNACAHARNALAALCACALLAGAMAGPAAADESAWPTAQAKAYNFDFVPYLDPPAKPAAICLVDSGVNITPDTPADSPDGPILERTSLDGGPGTGVDSDHGTYMAMTAGAPMNGWGTVGLWPGLRIVSIRVMPQGGNSFPFDDYRRALSTCRLDAGRLNVVAANLSLSCNCSVPPDAEQRLENTIADAHNVGMSVVSSVGNSGSDVAAPASAPGVLGVGATDAMTGALCAFSNFGPGLDVIAPGCGLDSADVASGSPTIRWTGGTSAGAAAVSAAIALIRSYRPDLTWQDVENFFVATPDASPSFELETAFRKAGLGKYVDEARRREAPTQSATADVIGAPAFPAPGRPPAAANVGDEPSTRTIIELPRPRFRVLVRNARRLVISVTNRPMGSRTVAEVRRRIGEFDSRRLTRFKTKHRVVRIEVPHRPRTLKIFIRFANGGRVSEPATIPVGGRR